MHISGVFILSIIFALITIYQIYQRKKLILKSEITGTGKIALLITIIALSVTAYRFGEIWYDYIIVIIGTIMMFVIISSSGITEDGFKSISRLKSPTQKWNGVDRVEVDIFKEFTRVSYSGNSEANLVYFKKEDYNIVVRKLRENLTDRSKIILK